MSLNLFLNFEHTNSEGLFYREVSTSSFTVSAQIKFADTALPIPARYSATYNLNDGNDESFNLITGQQLTFDRTNPCVSSVNVTIKDGDGTLLHTLSLSSKFVSRFPTVSFIAYPQHYIDENEAVLKTLDDTNWYADSPGVYFYGEGHTETIKLSAKATNATSSTTSIKWLIGNNFSDLSANSQISATTIENTNTATVEISSASESNLLIPISVYATNGEIEQGGPVVQYDDTTGEKSFYPFFATSLNTAGLPVSGDRTCGSIRVKPYPSDNLYIFNSPFVSNEIALPLNRTPQKFKASIEKNPDSSKILTSTLSSTTWEIKEFSKIGDWSWKTRALSHVRVYEFPLTYSETVVGESLMALYVPLGEKTTVTLAVSASSLLEFTYLPEETNDWIPRNAHIEHHQTITQILPIPFAELFISNYFVEKSTELVINSIRIYADVVLELSSISLRTDDNNKKYVIDPEMLEFPQSISFTKLGKRTIFVEMTFLNTNTNELQVIENSFEGIVDVVESINTIFTEESPQEYRTESSPVTFSYASSAVPLIAPNDWAIADNVNCIISEIYNLIESVFNHTTVYTKNDVFLGWLGSDKYAWSDLQCFSNIITTTQWSKYVTEATIDQPEPEQLVWNDNTCINSVVDPFCIQKYCIEWKWSSRTRKKSDLFVTWRSALSGESYNKKWKYEPCELNPITLTCPIGKWHTSTLDKALFPKPFCSAAPECTIISFAVTDQGKYVIARETEVLVLDNADVPVTLAKHTFADEIFAFSKIVKMELSRESLLYVLDSGIPRVSVLNIRPNDAILLSESWGKLGSASNPYGFKNPQDLHLTDDLEVIIADTGNKCIKTYTSSGKHKDTFIDERFQINPPLSIATDSRGELHVLIQDRVLVYDSDNIFVREYLLSSDVQNPKKLVFSNNREICYITHDVGVIKYFRNGVLFGNLIKDLVCNNEEVLTGFNDVLQDSENNIYVSVKDKVLKYADRMEVVRKSSLNTELYWSLSDVLIDKNEYIQPATYMKSFHKLWDNTELLRNSLSFSGITEATELGTAPFMKEDLVIGQNELVVNSVINRLSTQMWTNLKTLVSYVLPKSS